MTDVCVLDGVLHEIKIIKSIEKFDDSKQGVIIVYQLESAGD